MALANGVLVHGPTAWGCAVRLPDGTLKVASGSKPLFAPGVRAPVLRGPLRLAEAFALLPVVRRALPEVRFPFARPVVLAALAGSAVGARAVRRSGSPSVVRELAAAGLALTPALVALRGNELASYHGAEHVSIGTYETGAPAPKEHPRCGSQLVTPLVATSVIVSVAAARAPARLRGLVRAGGGVAAVGAAVEVFAWATKHPRHPVSRAIARPGMELQRRVSTAEPTPEQLEVADAAREACLAFET
jgi:uncharacterized protein YqhQ